MINISFLCASCKLFNNGCLSENPDVDGSEFCVGYEFKEDTHSDRVNHPNHYTQGGIECIRAIEASMSPDGFQDYCKGNVLKYIWRWRDKNGVEDLEKAAVYLNWMIESAKKYAGGIEECL